MLQSSSGSSGGTTPANEAAKIATYVHDALTKVGCSDSVAWKYALFSLEVCTYILTNPQVKAALEFNKQTKYVRELYEDGKDVYKGTKKVWMAEQLLENGLRGGKAELAVRNYRADGAAGVLKLFVDRFEGVAKIHGIELNECSLAVTKVALDIATAGAEVVTVWGLVLSGFTILSTFRDSYSLGTACFAPH